jgi:hypothetical protein
LWRYFGIFNISWREVKALTVGEKVSFSLGGDKIMVAGSNETKRIGAFRQFKPGKSPLAEIFSRLGDFYAL